MGHEYRYWPDHDRDDGRGGHWRLRRQGWLHVLGDNHLLFRPRSTQIVSLLGALPFALGDVLVYNLQWFSFIKMPWSFNDHSPYFYVAALPN